MEGEERRVRGSQGQVRSGQVESAISLQAGFLICHPSYFLPFLLLFMLVLFSFTSYLLPFCFLTFAIVVFAILHRCVLPFPFFRFVVSLFILLSFPTCTFLLPYSLPFIPPSLLLLISVISLSHSLIVLSFALTFPPLISLSPYSCVSNSIFTLTFNSLTTNTPFLSLPYSYSSLSAQRNYLSLY